MNDFEPGLGRAGLIQMPENIFADDNPHIHNSADGDHNAGECDNIGLHIEKLHGDEAEQNGQRQHGADDQSAAQMHHHDQHNNDGDQNFLPDRFVEGSECFVDQAGAVVEGNHRDLADGAVRQSFFRKRIPGFGDPGLDAGNHLQRVVAVAGDHDPADGRCAALVERPAPGGRSELNLCDMFDKNRHIVGPDPNDTVFNVGERFDESNAANEIFHPVDFDALGADINVGALHGAVDLVNAHAVGAHGVGINIHLIFANIAADRGNLGHPVGGEQPVAGVPVLNGAKLFKIPSAGWIAVGIETFERVPVDLTQCGGVRTELRLHAVGQGAGRKAVEFFQHARARPVELHILLKNYVDRRKSEHGIASDCLHAGNAQELDSERIADLVFHILR